MNIHLITKELLKRNFMKSFYTRVNGNSMFPCLKHNDKIEIRDVQIEKLKVKDIICFYKYEEHFTIHRIISISTIDGKPIFNTKGDNNDYIDKYNVNGNEIIGMVFLVNNQR